MSPLLSLRGLTRTFQVPHAPDLHILTGVDLELYGEAVVGLEAFELTRRLGLRLRLFGDLMAAQDFIELRVDKRSERYLQAAGNDRIQKRRPGARYQNKYYRTGRFLEGF